MLDAIKKYRPKTRFTALSDSLVISRVDSWISTQCVPLDIIMGGGIPIGRMVEIFGDTSTGKTLLALHILAETQKMGGIAVMLDTETSVAIELAEIIGVNVDELVYSNPDVIEDVFEDIMELVKIKDELYPDTFMTIVWDSVAATSSEAEVEKVMTEGLNTGYPPTAREISQMMRVLKIIIAKRNIALVMLNQAKEKIGVMFGSNIATFGGKAIGFYSSIRLLMKQIGKIKKHGEVIGITVRTYVDKNKVAPPFGVCTFPILFDVGIDDAGSVLDWLKEQKIVKTRGGWQYLTIGGEEFSFRSDEFGPIYEKHRDAVLNMLYVVDEEYEDMEDGDDD